MYMYRVYVLPAVEDDEVITMESSLPDCYIYIPCQCKGAQKSICLTHRAIPGTDNTLVMALEEQEGAVSLCTAPNAYGSTKRMPRRFCGRSQRKGS